MFTINWRFAESTCCGLSPHRSPARLSHGANKLQQRRHLPPLCVEVAGIQHNPSLESDGLLKTGACSVLVYRIADPSKGAQSQMA
jgi:hypothetical protein